MDASKDILIRMNEQYEGEVTRLEKNEKEVRSFLRLINSSEENVLTDEAHAKFCELCDKFIPNG